MLEYAELIKALRYCNDIDADGGCWDCNYEKRCRDNRMNHKSRTHCAVIADAADAIEELLAQKQSSDERGEYWQEKHLHEVPHWISVEEQLPRPFVSVLVNIPGEKPFPTVKEAFLEKTGMWYSIGFRYEQKEVTHWCEMPEPPKEDEETV